MSLRTIINLSLQFIHQKTVGNQPSNFRPRYNYSKEWKTGTILNQADELWIDERTLAASSSETLDLSGLLSQAFGDTLSLAKVKLFYLHNTSTIVGDVLEIGGGSNPFLMFKDGSDIKPVGPDGVLFWAEPSLAGRAVTATTADLIQVNNTVSNAIKYQVAIAGTTA